MFSETDMSSVWGQPTSVLGCRETVDVRNCCDLATIEY